MKPEIYGRSIFENSSFIVSSAHQDKSLWGRGFVARLSGSTAELVNMFLWMSIGMKPFFLKNSNLHLRFTPSLRKEFFTKKDQTRDVYCGGSLQSIHFPKNTYSFKFLGDTLVVYHNPKRRDLVAGETNPVRICIDEKIAIEADILPPPYSQKVRDCQHKRIDIYFD